MKKLFPVAIALGLFVLGAPAHAESGYASPEFQLRGPVFLDCLDTSPNPNLQDRTQDAFACVGPARTAVAAGDLYQVMYVRYRRYYFWGAVTFRCVPAMGPYNRYVHRFINLACVRTATPGESEEAGSTRQ